MSLGAFWALGLLLEIAEIRAKRKEWRACIGKRGNSRYALLTMEPPAPKRYHEEAPACDFSNFKTVVQSRRSIRVFDGVPIPEHIVEECLDLALLAPNSSNLQPWHFYWVRKASLRAELVKACFSQSAAKTASELIVCVARTGTWKANADEMLKRFDDIERTSQKVPESLRVYYSKIVPFAYATGPLGFFGPFKKLLLNAIGLFRPVPREPALQSELITWAVKSTALACENLMLALRAAGYDSCPMEGLDSVRVKKLLDLPSDAHIVMCVGAGRRVEGGVYAPQLRFDREKFITKL